MKSKKFSKSKSKFYEKSFTSIYRILVSINKGMYLSQMARKLGMSKQNVAYYLKKLEKEGYIQTEIRTSAKFYTLTEKGKEFLKKLRIKLTKSQKFSLPTTEEVRLHNLAIKFPILEDNPNFNWQRANPNLKNWLEKYQTLDQYGITLKKTTKHIIVYIHQFYAKDYSEWLNKLLVRIALVDRYLRDNGIKIDIFNGKVISQHIAITMNKQIEDSLKRIVGKKITASINLGRKAKSVYPSDLKAKAWIDYSLGRMELESNDMEYIENFMLMPERVARFEKLGEFILEQQYQFSQNLALHMEILREMKETLKEIRDSLRGRDNER